MPGEGKTYAFLCGCPFDKAKTYCFNVQTDGKTTWLSGQRFDEEGYEVCPEHGLRKFGWKTITVSTARGDQIDWHNMGAKNKKLRLNPKVAGDTRDMRDPERVGRKILAGHNGRAK